jgi:hypothetical protein
MGTLVYVWPKSPEGLPLERRTAAYWRLSVQCRGRDRPSDENLRLGVAFLLDGLPTELRLYEAVLQLGNYAIDMEMVGRAGIEPAAPAV